VELVTEPSIIVAATDAGARDRLLTFLTRGRGAVRVFARRLQRRPAAAVFHEPLQGGELTYVQSSESAPGRLFGFVPQRVWPGIRADFGRTVQALALLELVKISLTEGEPQGELFMLLVRALNRMESDTRPELVRLTATLRLLALSGFGLQLEGCVACGTPPAAGRAVPLSAEAGGMLCGACAAAAGARTEALTPGAHGFMLRALSLPESRIPRLRAGQGIVAEVSRVLDQFVEARMGVRPKASLFFEKIAPGTARRARRP
jgi:DNA repair protein RecO (recombination protein O)